LAADFAAVASKDGSAAGEDVEDAAGVVSIGLGAISAILRSGNPDATGLKVDISTC
jgi:hypothetical protein